MRLVAANMPCIGGAYRYLLSPLCPLQLVVLPPLVAPAALPRPWVRCSAVLQLSPLPMLLLSCCWWSSTPCLAMVVASSPAAVLCCSSVASPAPPVPDLLPCCSAAGPAASSCVLLLSPWPLLCPLCRRPSSGAVPLQQPRDDPSESLGDVHRLDRSEGVGSSASASRTHLGLLTEP